MERTKPKTVKGKISRNRQSLVTLNNKKIHEICLYVHRISGIPFQCVFDTFCEMVCEGYLLGQDTHLALLERVLKEHAGIEKPKW